MKDIIYIGIILFLAIFGYLMFKGQQKDCYNRYVKIHREQLLEEFERARHQKQNELQQQLEQIQKEYNEKQQQLNNSIEMADRLMKEQNAKLAFFTAEQNGRRAAIERDIEILRQQLTQDAQLEKEKQEKIVEEYREKARKEQFEIQKELDDFHKRRVAINEATLRERELKEKEDFYRVCLSDEDKADISFLLTIISNLKNKEIVYKLIWSEYIQKPFTTMTKNVLGTTSPKNVIYMITNRKTGEKYIGKTKQEVSKRWSDHFKTSLNIGGSSPKKIHKAMYGAWDEFTFEVLETGINEELLNEREKYYINLYESNIYGYNMIK